MNPPPARDKDKNVTSLRGDGADPSLPPKALASAVSPGSNGIVPTPGPAGQSD